MADNEENNHEYEFQDLGEVGASPEPDSETPVEAATSTHSNNFYQSMVQDNNVRTKVIYAGAVLVFLIVLKLLYSAFSHKKEAPVVPAAPIAPMPVVQPAPAPITEPIKPMAMDQQTRDQLAALETSNKNLQADMVNINSQLDSMSNGSNTLMSKVNDMNQQIVQLSAGLRQQSEQLKQLLIKLEPKKVKKVKKPAPIVQSNHYYLQAIIPGRAWLIAQNGSTITVREGTPIDGFYGTVKLIDAPYGRVVTSTGQVVRFSQEDS